MNSDSNMDASSLFESWKTPANDVQATAYDLQHPSYTIIRSKTSNPGV